MKKIKLIYYLKGFTAYEFQIGKFYWHFNFPRFWKTSGLINFFIDTESEVQG